MGTQDTSVKKKFKNEGVKSREVLGKIMSEHLGKEKVTDKGKDDFKSNLTIRIYSDQKCTDKYKDFLKRIKMEKWDIKYLDNGFSPKKTKELEGEYKTKSKNRKNFDEILMIIIDSYESFKNAIINNDKNFLDYFNNSLFPEQQPFFLFINKNLKDFEFTKSEEIGLDDTYKDFNKNCIDFISNIKEEYNVEIHYKFEYDNYSYIKSFLQKKKDNKDNFNIILDSNEYIYSSNYYEEESMDNIERALKNSKSITIRNLDYNIKLEDDFEYLRIINEKNNVHYYFEYYKPKFNKSFDEFLSNYDLLDKRNFKVQYFCYSPYIQLQRICGYYHEYGDLLIKDKFAKYPSKINIGVCGRAGAGKSTLLNVILGEKRCLEGQGTSVSTFITSYSHPKYPINFIDFPGFGDKSYSSDLINHIRTKNSELREVKEEIHVMIYCIKLNDRTFLDKEEDVIYELYKLNIKIIFVYTRGERENSSQFKRFKNSFLIDLEEILKKKNLLKTDENPKGLDLNEDIKIVSIYSMKEEKNGYTIEPFGMDSLFEKIYDSIKDKKIQKDILEKVKDASEDKINELIKSTNLMKICESRSKLIEAIREKVSMKISLFLGKVILCCPKYYFMRTDDIVLSLMSDINNLIYELSCVYCRTLDKDESIKLIKEIEILIKNFFDEGAKITTEDEEYKEIKGYAKWYLRILGIILSPIIIVGGGITATIYSGKIKELIYKAYEEETGINLSTYLYLFGEGLNEGIDGLEKLREEFRVSYNGH